MASRFLEYDSDYVLAPNGGLLQANGWDEVRQRIVRRILTNPRIVLDGLTITPDYLFDPNFGLGARARIGQNITPQMLADITQAVSSAVSQDSACDPNQPPKILTRISSASRALYVLVTVFLLNGVQGQLILAVQ